MVRCSVGQGKYREELACDFFSRVRIAAISSRIVCSYTPNNRGIINGTAHNAHSSDCRIYLFRCPNSTIDLMFVPILHEAKIKAMLLLYKAMLLYSHVAGILSNNSELGGNARIV